MLDLSLDTLAIHAGEEPDPTTGALIPPIHTSAAFKLPGFGPELFDALMMESHQPPYAYVRWGHPTARMLEEKVAALEGGESGLALRSILSVPLRVRQDVIGVLQVTDTNIDRFRPADQELLEPLALTAAVAIENARLYGGEQQRAVALAHALEQQRELDRLKNEFIQNVSHELRTPLAVVRGYVELLEGGELGELQPDQREPMGIIVSRVRGLSELVDNLVAILAIEARELEREPVDLANLVHTLLTGFEATAERARLSLAIEIAPDLPQVSGDPGHLRRMLDNLFSNALKFTPAGGSIAIRLWQDGENAVLEVTDTGIGVPQDQLDRIFERFYQVNGSTTKRYGGTGLGLALVKEIVETHEGQVTARSSVGEGSTFRVTLPLATAS